MSCKTQIFDMKGLFMCKKFYTSVEIDDFKSFLKISKRIPREYLWKAIGRWKARVFKQECFMKKYLVIFDRLNDEEADRSITIAMCRELAGQIREELSKEVI